ncbi:MAG: sigma-54-dependent transcriptional regulator [Thermoguttaceae bacterium]
MPQKILVIAEDSSGPCYQQALCPGGYEVHVCDRAAGIHAAVTGSFGAILVCHSGPDFDPLEVLREVKTAGLKAPVLVLSRKPMVEAAVAAIREGAADYLREPDSAEELRSLLDRIEGLVPRISVPDAAEIEPDSPPGFEGMLGRCPAMREVFALIQRIAPADATVLVAGESGTGKEMVVRAIHQHSRRHEAPLLACDCTALAPTLLESELFGHVKGSFSGAIATKRGLFEVAHQGTLFLDEVANLSAETQGKLLRVLETRRVRKVGDMAERDVDIRLVATTNRSLAEMVKTGAFRADLYYRLNVVPILLPPLRDRHGDISLLARAFLDRFSRQMGVEVKGFSPEALCQMEVHPWPGNVRELRNIVERLVVLYGGTQIELRHLPSEVREAKTAVSGQEVPHTWEELKRLKRQIVDDLERRFLTAALDRCCQSVARAAESVGMQRTNFHAMLRAHGLKSDGTKDG